MQLSLVECCEQNKQLLGVPVKKVGEISAVKENVNRTRFS